MCLLNWGLDVQPSYDSVGFLFRGDDGEELLASIEGQSFDTEAELTQFVKDLEYAGTGNRPLELELQFHSYFGGKDVGDDAEQVVCFGTARASFTPEGVTFTVPVEDYAVGNKIVCEFGDVLDLRIFQMLAHISPHTFAEFSNLLARMPMSTPPCASRTRRSLLRPTFREAILTDEQMAEVLHTDGIFYFRQLKSFINMKAENLKPYFRDAGISVENARDYPVTAAEVRDQLLPHLDKTAKNFKLVNFAGFVKETLNLPLYEKPPRTETSPA